MESNSVLSIASHLQESGVSVLSSRVSSRLTFRIFIGSPFNFDSTSKVGVPDSYPKGQVSKFSFFKTFIPQVPVVAIMVSASLPLHFGHLGAIFDDKFRVHLGLLRNHLSSVTRSMTGSSSSIAK